MPTFSHICSTMRMPCRAEVHEFECTPGVNALVAFQLDLQVSYGSSPDFPAIRQGSQLGDRCVVVTILGLPVATLVHFQALSLVSLGGLLSTPACCVTSPPW